MRSERVLIKPNHDDYSSCKQIARLSKQVFNQALYYKRHAFFRSEFLSFSNLDQLMKIHHKSLYDSLPNAGSQAVIKKLSGDFDNFWKALNDWKAHPEKYTEKPQIPKYKKQGQLKTFLLPAKPISVKESHILLPKKMNISPVISRFAEDKKANSSCDIFKEIRIVPHGSCFWIEIVYDETQSKNHFKKNVKLNPDNKLAIDIGINVLMAVTSNQANFKPVLINGKPIKSINQYFNKQKAKLMSQSKKRKINRLSIKRYNQIRDYFHKCSNYILQLCLKHDVGEVIIGKNKNWKQAVNIGKVNNQKFVSIPHFQLIGQLKYKLEAYGILVREREESYTSKADSLACDKLPAYKKGASHIFGGKRVKRGLYLSSTGKTIHADVNGSLNILRKASNDDFIEGLIRSGCVFQPSYWTPNGSVVKKSKPLDCFSDGADFKLHLNGIAI